MPHLSDCCTRDVLSDSNIAVEWAWVPEIVDLTTTRGKFPVVFHALPNARGGVAPWVEDRFYSSNEALEERKVHLRKRKGGIDKENKLALSTRSFVFFTFKFVTRWTQAQAIWANWYNLEFEMGWRLFSIVETFKYGSHVGIFQAPQSLQRPTRRLASTANAGSSRAAADRFDHLEKL